MMKGEEIKRQLKGGVIIDGKHIETELLKEDRELLWEINDVFYKHGWKGRIIRLVYECGTPPPKPEEIKKRCFRKCRPGPKGEPICEWECY